MDTIIARGCTYAAKMRGLIDLIDFIDLIEFIKSRMDSKDMGWKVNQMTQFAPKSLENSFANTQSNLNIHKNLLLIKKSCTFAIYFYNGITLL